MRKKSIKKIALLIAIIMSFTSTNFVSFANEDIKNTNQFLETQNEQSLKIVVNSDLQSTTPSAITVKLKIDGIESSILPEKEVSIEENKTALDLLKTTLDNESIPYNIQASNWGDYVTSINNQAAGYFGGWDGWMYQINGQDAFVGASSYVLKPSDTIRFYYSRYPNLETESKTEFANQKFKVTINLKGDTFKTEASNKANWDIDLGTSNLTLDSIDLKSNQKVELNFIGKQRDGKLIIIPKSEALEGNKAGDKVEVLVGYKPSLDKSLKYIKNQKSSFKLYDEWSILSLVRGGTALTNTEIKSYTQEITSNKTKLNDFTDYARISLALTALGEDITKVGDENFLQKLSDYDFVIRQGINGAAFGLIMLNSHDYEIPKNLEGKSQNTEAKMRDYILANEIASGGWALTGEKLDVDITAMVIQALAPYYKSGNKDVITSVDKAFLELSKLQKEDGNFESLGIRNSSSTAQVLVAICELGKNPLDESLGFIKNGNTIIDGLLIYQLEDGGFKHTLSESIANSGATDQCTYALVAYDRFLNSKNSFYNLRDVKVASIIPIEKIPFENNLKIPNKNNTNFEVAIAQNVSIDIPDNMDGKTFVIIDRNSNIPKIEAQKGLFKLLIPEGIDFVGDSKLELFSPKTDFEKNLAKTELSQKLQMGESSQNKLTISSYFKVGGTAKIEFSDYVELVFTNMAGKGAAYVDNTGMHIIERVANDTEGIGKSEYAFDRGNDLVVKTKHFTDFVTYSVQKDTGNTGGTGGSGGVPPKDLTVNLSIDKKTINKGYVINPTSIKINKGDTVWDVTKKVMDENNISYNYKGSGSSVYISDISGDGEFDHGQNSGWMYSVNGSFTKDGSGQYRLNGGENIQWRYTTNLGEDLGQDNSSFKSNNVVSNEAEKGSTILKAEAKVDKKEAKVELDSKRILGAVKEAVEKKLSQIVIEPTVEDKKAEFNKVSVVLEKESIEKIAKEAKASLKLKTKFGDVKLSANTLENLLKEKGNTVTISVKQNEDNTVTVDVKVGLDSLDKISGGMIVTLPVSEASVSNIMVKVAEDNTEQIIMKSVAADKMLSAKLEGSAKVKIVQREVDFADTSAHWAKENIEFVSARDIIKGTKANEFSPNSRVNRAMLTTILHRFENELQIEGQNYSDVTKEAYYSNAALWAKTKGIVSRTEKFGAKEELTREQIAEMIYNYAKASGENVSNISKANVQKFEDFSTIDSASQDAVAYCYEKGIIGGKSETKLDPKGKATRAEVSAIIQRYISNSVK